MGTVRQNFDCRNLGIKPSPLGEDLEVHIVFTPKYRKRVLYEETGERVWDIIRQVCKNLEIEIISGKVTVDHVHLFL